jgi:hypothetical protein
MTNNSFQIVHEKDVTISTTMKLLDQIKEKKLSNIWEQKPLVDVRDISKILQFSLSLSLFLYFCDNRVVSLHLLLLAL